MSRPDSGGSRVEAVTPRISAIIPTHNRCESLPEALRSLQEQDLPATDYEIILVDNASTDQTRAVVDALNRNGPRPILYVEENRLGLHHARHAAAQRARGSVLAFTDDDAVCEPDWLRHLLAHYDDPEVGCVGGKISPRWASPPPAWVLRSAGALALLDRGDVARALRWPEDIYGCNFSIRRDLLFSMGGFNPDSFGSTWWGDGETGLLRKVYDAGYQVLYEPAARVWHRIPPQRMTLAYMRRRFANQGRADGYSAYRRRPWRLGPLVRSGLYGAAGVAFAALSLLEKPWGTDSQARSAVRAAYCRARAAYELRLAFDRELRTWARCDDWIRRTESPPGPEAW